MTRRIIPFGLSGRCWPLGRQKLPSASHRPTCPGTSGASRCAPAMASEVLAYRRRLREKVAREIEKGARSLRALVSVCEGADPLAVQSALDECSAQNALAASLPR